MKIVRAVIAGKVQGVWFRAWTVDEATKRGLRGWVRNRKDGSVEALFAGDPAKVDTMVAACREGPPLAKVENVELHEAAGEKVPAGFDHRRTA
ncbi:MAG: acylphosphatase [Dongiaceae bacterium]